MLNDEYHRNPLPWKRMLAALMFALVPQWVMAQSEIDLVILWDANRTEQLKYSGRILEYTNLHLTMKMPSGAERQIESNRVVEIMTAWRSEYREAEDLFHEKQYERAEKGFRRAATQETRGWIQERIQARILLCLRAQGKWTAAATLFSEGVQKTNPASPYLSTIPLAWHTLELTPPLQGQATRFLESTFPLERLIGASWLLASPIRGKAIAVLQQLELNSNKELAILATAQLWRTKLPIALAADLVQWKKTIDRLPLALQAGPLYVLGQLQKQQQATEHAVLTWMRVVILYPQNHQLNSEALLAAIGALHQLDKPTQALTLCRELKNNYESTTAADQASRWIEQIQQEIMAADNKVQ